MSKFKPGDVVYRENDPMYMYLVVQSENGIRCVSFQEHTYDGSSKGLAHVIQTISSSYLFFPKLQPEPAPDEDLVFLTNISMVLAHLEVELQKLREEKDYEAIPF